MVWVDNISQLEYYRPNPQWGCYSEPVQEPNDILLQARYHDVLNFANTVDYEINVRTPDGTLLETLTTANPYFDVFNAQFTNGGLTYNYTNIRCNQYTTTMLSNSCFILEFKLFDGTGKVYFNKYTQKYLLRDSTVPVSMITISGATEDILYCGSEPQPNLCGIPNTKLVAIFDCIDTFTGDYYGDGVVLPQSFGLFPFPFVKLSNIQGRFRSVPSEIKRTISLNCRTQKTETTERWMLQGIVAFPVWKMQEIQRMMLANHIYVDGVEYQTEGGTFFKQIGKPYNCQYSYQLSIDFIGCYEWQIFGCQPVCESQSYYFLIP